MRRVGFEEVQEILQIIDPSQIDEIAGLIRSVYMDEKLRDYIVHIVFALEKSKGLPDGYRRLHSVRRIPPSDDFPEPGGQGLRLSSGQGLCHPPRT